MYTRADILPTLKKMGHGFHEDCKVNKKGSYWEIVIPDGRRTYFTYDLQNRTPMEAYSGIRVVGDYVELTYSFRLVEFWNLNLTRRTTLGKSISVVDGGYVEVKSVGYSSGKNQYWTPNLSYISPAGDWVGLEIIHPLCVSLIRENGERDFFTRKFSEKIRPARLCEVVDDKEKMFLVVTPSGQRMIYLEI